MVYELDGGDVSYFRLNADSPILVLHSLSNSDLTGNAQTIFSHTVKVWPELYPLNII